jgi:phosphate transport system permease protein
MLSIPMYDSALMFAALLLMVVVILFNLLGRMTINYYETRMN